MLLSQIFKFQLIKKHFFFFFYIFPHGRIWFRCLIHFVVTFIDIIISIIKRRLYDSQIKTHFFDIEFKLKREYTRTHSSIDEINDTKNSMTIIIEL